MLVPTIKRMLKEKIMDSFLANVFINRFSRKSFMGEMAVKSHDDFSKQFLSKSYHKGRFHGPLHSRFMLFAKQARALLDALEENGTQGAVKNTEISSTMFNNVDDSKLEVIRNKEYGTIQVLCEKNQEVIRHLSEFIDATPNLQKILRMYGSPKITGAKIERKRTTKGVISPWGYEYNSCHVDGYHTSLKIYFFLSEVSPVNGPMRIYESTANWDKYPKIAFAIKFLRQQYFDHSFCDAFKELEVSLTGKIGDYVVFSGNSLHSATNVQVASRDTIQIYFDQFDKKWFEKIN